MVPEQGRNGVRLAGASWWRKVLTALLLLAAIVLAGVIFHRFFRIAATIVLLAAMLTYLLQPLVEWMVRVSRFKQLHAARTGATLLVYVLLALALYFFGAAMANAVRIVRGISVSYFLTKDEYV